MSALGERYRQMLVDHGEQAGELFVIAVRVDGGLLDHRFERGVPLRCHRQRIAPRSGRPTATIQTAVRMPARSAMAPRRKAPMAKPPSRLTRSTSMTRARKVGPHAGPPAQTIRL